MFNALYPEESRWDKIRGEISLGKKKSPFENIVKKEDGRKEKGQDSQNIGCSDPSFFPFYVIYHRELRKDLLTYHLS